MKQTKEKHGAVLWWRPFLPPLAPAVYTHVLIQMPQTYTVSPGGDTVYAVTSTPRGISFCGTGGDGRNLGAADLLGEVREAQSKSREFGRCCSTNAAQCGVNGSETRSAAFVNTAISTFLCERDQKLFCVTSLRDTL